MNYLTEEQLEDFHRDGIIVIENVLHNDEVQYFRDAFHKQLQLMGINHDKLLNREDKPDGNIRMKSDIANIFYDRWKMDIHFHVNVCSAMDDLLKNTYGSDNELYTHPFGKFDSINGYIDRVCYRMPDHIQQEGGLKMHMDRLPYKFNMKKAEETENYKWRPIQAFVAFTDHYSENDGGLKVVKGFHRRFNEYFKDKLTEEDPNDGGQFYRMNVGHDKLLKECQSVVVPAGSLVCWDYRLPHATSDKLIGSDTREVVYTGFLPEVKINREYLINQMIHYNNNIAPPAYYKNDDKKCDKTMLPYIKLPSNKEEKYFTMPKN